MELLSPRPAYHEESRQARNAEEALLAVLNSCARVTAELSRIDWPQSESEGGSETAFGDWLRNLQGQRTGDSDLLVFKCLSLLDLSGQLLFVSDLYGANLEGASLVETGLTLATLARTNLREADLRKSNLQQSNLQGANLQRALLQAAKLQWANLGNANLRNANLENANLQGAKLTGADLQGANLKGANLERANLDGAILEGAILVNPSQLRGTRGSFAGSPRFFKPRRSRAPKS